MSNTTDHNVCPIADWDGHRPLEHSCCLRARQLAKFVVALDGDFGWDQSDAFQESGTRLGVVELRRVEPGSQDAEDWGEDAELYYLVPWVRELAGSE